MMITSDLIAVVAGTVLSLVLSYIPGLNTRWAALQPDQKRLWMLVLLVVATAGVYVGACRGIVPDLACPTPWEALWQLILAAIANQTAYSLSPGAKGRRESE